MDSLEKMERARPGKSLLLLILPLLLLVSLAVSALILFEREQSQVTLLTDIARLGRSRELSLVLTDGKRGLRSVEVFLVQDGKESRVFARGYDGQGVLGLSGPARAEETFTVSPADLKLKDGEAALVVRARDYSWWAWRTGNLAEVSIPTAIDVRPPLVRIVESTRYIIPGGAGVVTYRIDEPVSVHGALVNGHFHPGFPLPQKGEGVYAAVLALPHDAARIEQSQVRAVDLAGNENQMPFGMIMRKNSRRDDRIDIPDSFLAAKLPEFASYYPEISGREPLEQYLEINGRIRQENNAAIAEICSKSRPERLWDGRFQRLPRSSRRAGYAEYRTYYHQGREIDRQVHLGIDLASTSQSPVAAANRGEVVFAGYLGIYGNMVMIDHGGGVFTLYSHLSRIDVEPGAMVTTESIIGHTGTTGMAGGDHLHFSVLVNGIFVNPLEWWDPQWLKLNILDHI